MARFQPDKVKNMLQSRNTYAILLAGFHEQKKGVKKITRLKQVRRAKGFTQAQLAQASGVHRVTISRLESGKFSANVETLEKLANALGVTVGDLVGEPAT